MTKYRVPVAMVFTGAVEVEAKDETEAEEVAVWNVSGRLGIFPIIFRIKYWIMYSI